MDRIVCEHLKLDTPEADMTEWKELEEKVLNLKKKVRIALVGKYVELPDAYISVVEALKHSGFAFDADIELEWIKSQDLTRENVEERLKDADGILVPGGFGDRGLEGKIEAIRYARENDVPFLGICLGMQMACVEFARNVVGLEDAASAETNPDTANNIIDLMADQENIENLGGTLRLGLYPCKIKKERQQRQPMMEKMLFKNVTVIVMNSTINIVNYSKKTAWYSQGYHQTIVWLKS